MHILHTSSPFAPAQMPGNLQKSQAYQHLSVGPGFRTHHKYVAPFGHLLSDKTFTKTSYTFSFAHKARAAAFQVLEARTLTMPH